MTFIPADLLWQAPVLVLALTSVLLVVVEAFTDGVARAFVAKLAVAGCVVAAASTAYVWRQLGGQPHPIMAACWSPTTSAAF